MKLIVGLGNPGNQYYGTRHNCGFIFLDKFAEDNNFIINKSKFEGLYCKCNINGEDVILLKPQKYMNLSGEVVKKYVDYFKIDINDLLIISDDMDLPVGKIKLKLKGSSGGHNGLKNIENNLGTSEYKRLKIGIGKNNLSDSKDYVLGKFNKSEIDELLKLVPDVLKIIEQFPTESFEKLMSIYNAR